MKVTGDEVEVDFWSIITQAVKVRRAPSRFANWSAAGKHPWAVDPTFLHGSVELAQLGERQTEVHFRKLKSDFPKIVDNLQI